MAVAIVRTDNGFARTLSAQLWQVLIVELGWRWAYLALGGVMAAVVLPLATLFR